MIFEAIMNARDSQIHKEASLSIVYKRNYLLHYTLGTLGNASSPP